MTRISKLAILLATTAMPALAALPAAAQSAAAPTTSDAAPAAVQSQGPAADTTTPPGGIQEVVVTANRVETTAQRTPIALTVYSNQALQQAGIHSIQALQTIDPSINVVSSSGSAYVAVRGIASTDVTEIGDPSVPIARDGFFTNRSFNIASSLYDLQRVEVLKGPQGTLFGRNSTGGLISVITNKPTDSYGGFASVTAGDYDTLNLEGAVNAPVGDWMQVRLSGIVRYHDGYRDLSVIDQGGDDERTESFRAQVAFQPFQHFNGLISFQHDHTNDHGDVAYDSPLGEIPDFSDPQHFPSWQPSSNYVQDNRIRWELNYDGLPAGLTLTYQGGYDASKWRHELDATPPGANPLRQFIQAENPDTWNHEVRIATPQDQRLTFQGGYYHFEESNNLDSGEIDRSGAFEDQYLIHFLYDVKTVSNAVFGQAGFKVTDQIKLTAGARYTWDSKIRTGDAILNLQVASGGYLPPIIIDTPGNGQISQSEPTYHLGVDYTPNSTTLFYAKFDTGYKSGGFNSNGSAPSVDYGPEHLDAWEAGMKNRFLDNHLQLNIDGFYQKYSGYQASQTTAVISSGSGVFNIGSAKIYGAEAQVIALLGEDNRFDANATWLHARFDDNVGDVTRGDSAATPVDIGGNALPNAPGFAATAGFEHYFNLPNARITARIDGKYSSAFYFTVFNDADTRQKDYATGNLSLIYAPTGGRWQVEGFVRNFTDTTVLVNGARNYNSNWNTYEFAPPRTFGGRFSVTF